MPFKLRSPARATSFFDHRRGAFTGADRDPLASSAPPVKVPAKALGISRKGLHLKR